jgi:tellurite resistance protein
MDTENKKDEKPPSFAAMLAQVRPRTDVEAAETLRKVIEAVKATGKVGSITIKLDVKPADGLMDAVVVYDRISQKVPEKTREGSMAFITQAGDLSRTDPSSMPLFTDEDIRDAGADVDLKTGEIKEAPDA